MIYVGIDVAKDKHDCCILDANAEKLFPTFTIQNNQTGFGELYERLNSVTGDNSEIKVGLEATGHYSLNLLGSLIDKGLTTSIPFLSRSKSAETTALKFGSGNVDELILTGS